MSKGSDAIVIALFIETLMKAGGHREIHIDELRRAITMIGEHAKHKVKKESDQRYSPYWFEGIDVYDHIMKLVKGWEEKGLAEMYRIEVDTHRAGGEAVLIKSERAIEEEMKEILRGVPKSEINFLTPIMRRFYVAYNQSVLQKYGGDFY